jgi:predicted GNAT family acetyltransferase
MKFTEYVFSRYSIVVDSKAEGFIDVDTITDTRDFIDPFKIARCTQPNCANMQQKILDFYRVFLANIISGNTNSYLEAFHEVKPIRLGFAGDSFNGKGIGSDLVSDIIESIKNSKAFQTGKIQDLEDFTFMIENVSNDRLSDLVSNIILEDLIRFTSDICSKYKIPTSRNYYVKDGLTYFDIDRLEVKKLVSKLPLDAKGRPFILVPNCISKQNSLSLQGSTDYYNHGIIVHLMRNENLFTLLTNREFDRKYRKKHIKEFVELKYKLLKPGSVKFANFYINTFDIDMESVKIYKDFRNLENIKIQKEVI